MEKHIHTPLTEEVTKDLRAGDYVYITGTIYVARDAAHQRIYEAMNANKEIAIPLENNIIYYMGPSPAKEGQAIGSADLLQPAEWTDMRPRSWIWD